MLTINKPTIFFILTFILLTTQNAFANEELAKSNNCLLCHSVDNKVVGPAFKDIAAKYKGVDGAAEALASKVKNGTSGTWGNVAMPPNSGVSDEDIQTLVKWILSL